MHIETIVGSRGAVGDFRNQGYQKNNASAHGKHFQNQTNNADGYQYPTETLIDE